MKLLLLLSHSGLFSRRKAFDHIRSGAVKVNGRTVDEPSVEVDPEKDEIMFRQQKIGAQKFDYVVLNKPSGYVTTCSAQFEQKSVMELLPKDLRHVKPVGRLDKDTEGLLLFTNDGELANLLTHPRFDVDKTYYARVRGALTPIAVRRLEQGVKIDGVRTAPAILKVLQESKRESEIEITIHEGRKHQVRLMLKAVGNPVSSLRRLKQGPLSLAELKRGTWRHLTEEEIAQLRSIKAKGTGHSSEKKRAPYARKTSSSSASSSRPGAAKTQTSSRVFNRDPFARKNTRKSTAPGAKSSARVKR